MKFLRQYRAILAVLAVTIALIGFRLWAYGDVRLSIANSDTGGYIASAETPLLSWEAFTSRRLFTTNLVYQVLKPAEGYEIVVNGSQDTVRRQIQPTFIGVILFQTGLSLAGWGLFVIAFTGRLRNKWLQIPAALLILSFAFTPTVADWDSLLTSESLTFSLFVLQLGLLLILAPSLIENPAPSRGRVALLTAWLVTVFFWTFLRDTNLYALLIDMALILGFLILPHFRRQKYLWAVFAALAAIFILGWTSSGQSPRNRIAMKEVYEVLGSPSIVNFMKAHGMPEPGSPEYTAWFPEHAKGMYLTFLANHPGFVFGLFFRDSFLAFTETVQPYFNARNLPSREILLRLDSALHPTSPTPMILDVVLLAGILAAALRRRTTEAISWAGLAVWTYLVAMMCLAAAVFGDAYGLTRHALIATTILRLFMWVMPVVLIDLALPRAESARPDSPGPIPAAQIPAG